MCGILLAFYAMQHRLEKYFGAHLFFKLLKVLCLFIAILPVRLFAQATHGRIGDIDVTVTVAQISEPKPTRLVGYWNLRNSNDLRTRLVIVMPMTSSPFDGGLEKTRLMEQMRGVFNATVSDSASLEDGHTFLPMFIRDVAIFREAFFEAIAGFSTSTLSLGEIKSVTLALVDPSELPGFNDALQRVVAKNSPTAESVVLLNDLAIARWYLYPSDWADAVRHYPDEPWRLYTDLAETVDPYNSPEQVQSPSDEVDGIKQWESFRDAMRMVEERAATGVDMDLDFLLAINSLVKTGEVAEGNVSLPSTVPAFRSGVELLAAFEPGSTRYINDDGLDLRVLGFEPDHNHSDWVRNQALDEAYPEWQAASDELATERKNPSKILFWRRARLEKRVVAAQEKIAHALNRVAVRPVGMYWLFPLLDDGEKRRQLESIFSWYASEITRIQSGYAYGTNEYLEQAYTLATKLLRYIDFSHALGGGHGRTSRLAFAYVVRQLGIKLPTRLANLDGSKEKRTTNQRLTWLRLEEAIGWAKESFRLTFMQSGQSPWIEAIEESLSPEQLAVQQRFETSMDILIGVYRHAIGDVSATDSERANLCAVLADALLSPQGAAYLAKHGISLPSSLATKLAVPNPDSPALSERTSRLLQSAATAREAAMSVQGMNSGARAVWFQEQLATTNFAALEGTAAEQLTIERFRAALADFELISSVATRGSISELSRGAAELKIFSARK
jgi:hypothetical protein